MLWINLMMDVLAAVALGTDPYKRSNKSSNNNRISRQDKLISNEMARHIVMMGLY
jgi:magnesium-transporting ATPase (P-type)